MMDAEIMSALFYFNKFSVSHDMNGFSVDIRYKYFCISHTNEKGSSFSDYVLVKIDLKDSLKSTCWI